MLLAKFQAGSEKRAQVVQVQKPDPFFTVHVGDARDLRSVLESRPPADRVPITCTVTSPPYADLIDYKVGNQIGWGQSYQSYLEDCREIFKSIYDATAEDGSLWLVADTVYDQSRRPSIV